MAVDAAQFRANFPEFSNTTEFPDSVVNFWFQYAYILLNARRWGQTLDLGAQLFVAHNIVLEQQASKQAATGGTPGVTTGAVASKAVGPASISYDNSASLELDAGHWNLTTYGKRLIRMIRMFGAGPVQVGMGCSPYAISAWNGPWPWPLPGGSGFSS